MAVYRSDQAQLTIAAEAAAGGDPEMNSGTRHTGGFSGLINDGSGIPAGSTQITYDGGSNTLYKGDFIRIGNTESDNSAGDADDSNTVNEFEIRRVVHFTGTSAGTIFLDRPTAFFHADNEIIINIEGTASTLAQSYITEIPGVYDSVTLPEFTPTIEPRYLLGTSSDRNFTKAYSGTQSFSGSLPAFVVVDATPLRFPIGKMTTVPSSVASDTILLSAAAKKGDIYISCDGSDVGNLADNDYIQITDDSGGTDTSEVRQIKDEVGTSNTFRLDRPLQFDHPDNTVINEVSGGSSPSGTFTHTISETFDLDTLSWNVLFRDSAETAANDLQRRYVGGIVDSATLSASEGGMLMMSYDSVPFLDMVHNQANQGTVGDNIFADGGSSEDAGMPRYSIMNSIGTSDVNFPSTEPYYFSQGSFTLFGQEFARVRNIAISISNSVEPRYYISPRHGRHRGPSEFREGRRAYSLSCTVALPDTVASTATTVNSANEIFKQGLLEGNYGDGNGLSGFAITLTFTRGTNDTITITIPNDGTAATGLNEAGAFILSAPYNITGDPIIQADLDILFRNMKIEIVDTKPVYM